MVMTGSPAGWPASRLIVTRRWSANISKGSRSKALVESTIVRGAAPLLGAGRVKRRLG